MGDTISDVNAFVRVMTASIAPVTVISGLAFLLSIIAGRYGRCIDRVRELLHQLKDHQEIGPVRERMWHQIHILYRRARVLRTSMVFASISIFFVSLTIIMIFGGLIYRWNTQELAAILFVIALVSLLVSLGLLIRDLVVSLRALKLEIIAQIPEHVSKPLYPRH
jgi:uncharacterized ion transporter superfamily protein YfcC